LTLQPRYLSFLAESRYFSFTLLSDGNEEIVDVNDLRYIPEELNAIGEDTVVNLTIDLETGMVVGWKRPSNTQLKNLIKLTSENEDDNDEEDEDD